jgi:hypothetical protein
VNSKCQIQEDLEQPVETSKRILYNDKSFPVSESLFSALSHLRHHGISGRLWVDAICIRQDDLVKKASQVQLMSQIYGSAEEVVIWLGPECEYLSDVVWTFNTFYAAVEKDLEDHGTSGNRLGYDIGNPALHRYLGVEKPLERLYRT